MSLSPAPSPSAKQPHSLRHSRTLPSLNDSIQKLRDYAPFDVPSKSPQSEVPPPLPRTLQIGQSASPHIDPTEMPMAKDTTAPPLRAPVGGQRFARQNLYSAMSVENLARSPKERFQALMSSSKSRSNQDSRRGEQQTESPKSARAETSNKPATNQGPLNQRTISSPILQTATASPTSSPQPVRRTTGEVRLVEDGRNPSFESASSTRSANLSTTISPAVDPRLTSSPLPRPISGATDTDIASLIASAGSAEIVITQLLKERQATASRSEQLWQLVEKQRTMILGLNSDLERALKDKEKYRKKLNEQAEIPANTQLLSGQTEESDPPPANDNEKIPRSSLLRLKTQGMPNGSPISVISVSTKQPDSPLTPISLDEKTDRNLPSSPTRGRADSVPQHIPYEQSSPRNLLRTISEQATTSANGFTPQTNHSHTSQSQAPLALNERTRKAPPTPLNLLQSQQMIAPLNIRPARPESESDYSDMSECAESVRERGRRQTREDDDRQREVAPLDEERRIRAAMSSQSPSKSKPPEYELPAQVDAARPLSWSEVPRINGAYATGLPNSPRAPLLGGIQSSLPPSMNSVASLLKQDDPHPFATTTTISTAVYAPLKSPGLPLSPRPGDRPGSAPQPRPPIKSAQSSPSLKTHHDSEAFPPALHSARSQMAPNVSGAPRSPQYGRSHSYGQQLPQLSSLAERVEPPHTTNDSRSDISKWKVYATLDASMIYKGLVSEQYPHLLLPPNALPVIDVKVHSSRLMPPRTGGVVSKNNEEEMTFTLGISTRSENRQLWRVEKTLLALQALDKSLKTTSGFSARLPDKSLFSSHAPAKVDIRRSALNVYFDALLDMPVNGKAALQACEFLSTDAIAPHSFMPAPAMSDADSAVALASLPDVKRKKEGYLAKKGKSLGAWKARYFVLHGPELQYFEAPGGEHLGSIKLLKSQIARQTASYQEDVDYRHAFMIMEPKRKDSSSLNRHILCAESDEERDEWVEALVQYTELDGDDDVLSQTAESTTSSPVPNNQSSDLRKMNSGSKPVQGLRQQLPQLQTVGYDQTVPATAPILGGGSARSSWSPSTDNGSDSGAHTGFQLSNGQSGSLSQALAASGQSSQLLGKKSPSLTKEPKKRNFFGFRTRASEDNIPVQHQRDGRTGGSNHPLSRSDTSLRAVFGAPLAAAADLYAPKDIDICLPAPVYRCIEYLEAKRAGSEEGIFRLSGSSLAIKALKERFNSEEDIKLLDGQHHDIHVVASLLKLYLRELPESVLTRDLHLDFLKIIDSSEDIKQKVIGINMLVHKLPEPNLELLATLSRFLIDIVNKCDVNKMTVRNVGIVFSPTLNIPAPLVSLFLTDYGSIFGSPADATPSQMIQTVTARSSTSDSAPINGADGIRSPRKQIYTDLPTPAYHQSSFSQQAQGNAFFNQQAQQMLRKQLSHQVLQDPRAAYDSTGFMPLQQTYDRPPALALSRKMQQYPMSTHTSGKGSIDGRA